MAKFNLVTIKPEGYPHYRAFDEIKTLLYYSLSELGHTVAIEDQPFTSGCTNIIFGAHLLDSSVLGDLPQHSVIFNTEQLGACPPACSERIVSLSRIHPILDYSSTNLLWLERNINTRWPARLARLRLGFHPSLERLKHTAHKDHELVFFGSITPFREALLQKINEHPAIKLTTYFGYYGWARNSILERSKIALNLHSSSARILEWPRLVFLVANKMPTASLVHPETRCDDDQLSYIYRCSEADASMELAILINASERLKVFAEDSYERLRESEQLPFTEQAFDALFPGELQGSSALPIIKKTSEMTSTPDLDERWYRLTYGESDSDPRTIKDFHLQVGIHRQYHPNRLFHTKFKRPLLLPYGLTNNLPPSSDASIQKHGNQPKVAIIFHAHSLRLLAWFFADFAVNLADHADLYISTTQGDVAEIGRSLACELGINLMDVRLIPNRGRDIPSKYTLFNQELSSYDLCLFTHGKESDLAWFHHHNHCLAGSKSIVQQILELFQNRSSLGLLFPDYLPHLRPFITWAACRPLMDQLLANYGCDTSAISLLEFPAGGFFWARPEALAAIHSLNLKEEHLPPEPLIGNSTLLHALERMPCISCELLGLEWEKLKIEPDEG